MNDCEPDADVIAIDGPAGSGKGTLSASLAHQFGWHYLDSGAIYRVAALHAVRQGLPLGDEVLLSDTIQQLNIGFRGGLTYLGQEDVSEAIRNESCASATSKISALPLVRAALLDLQKSFQRKPGLIADGRDMGTVVFPGAKLKLFLTASVDSRAQRRFKQLRDQGINANLATLVSDISQRDERDASRKIAPLKPADDAIVLDTSEMNANQVLKIALDYWNKLT